MGASRRLPLQRVRLVLLCLSVGDTATHEPSAAAERARNGLTSPGTERGVRDSGPGGKRARPAHCTVTSPCRLPFDGSPDEGSPWIDGRPWPFHTAASTRCQRLWATRGGRGPFPSLVHLSIFPTRQRGPPSSEDEGLLSGPPARPPRERPGLSQRSRTAGSSPRGQLWPQHLRPRPRGLSPASLSHSHRRGLWGRVTSRLTELDSDGVFMSAGPGDTRGHSSTFVKGTIHSQRPDGGWPGSQ